MSPLADAARGVPSTSTSVDSLELGTHDPEMARRVQDMLAKLRAEAGLESSGESDTSASNDGALASRSGQQPRFAAPTAALLSRLDLGDVATATESLEADSLENEPPQSGGGVLSPSAAANTNNQWTPQFDTDSSLQRSAHNTEHREALMRRILGTFSGNTAAGEAATDNGGSAARDTRAPQADPHDLADVFPDLSLDEHSVRWLRQKYTKQLDAVARNAIDGSRHPLPDDPAMTRVARQEEARVKRLRKDRDAAERREAHLQQQSQSRAVRRGIYERRRTAGALQKYYHEFHLTQQARLQRGKSKEEELLRTTLDTSVKEYSEQIRNAKVYAKEKRDECVDSSPFYSHFTHVCRHAICLSR
jgi:hypothetical protein